MRYDASRRQFLRTASLMGAMGVGAPIAINLAAAASASAQTAPDYKAVVCFYLGGGNDAFSTLIPCDSMSYSSYQSVRGSLALSRPASGALAATSPQGGRQVGMSAGLPGLKGLYDAGRLAVLANVGPLNAPSSKLDLAAGRVAFPRQRGSHNDQHDTWDTLGTENPYGWGGRMGDMLAASNGAATQFTVMSGTGGYSSFLVGAQTSFFSVSDGGMPTPFFQGRASMTAAVLGGGSSNRTNLLEQAYVQVHERLRDGAATLQGSALTESSLASPPSQNLPAAQLRTLARIIGANQAIGVKRQVFYVELSGFDTHNGQLGRHAALMTQLNDALVYFDTLLGQLNLRDQVTVFTTSEFGRTYAFNGDGTDHGWGGHHFIMGGAVNGGQIYGTLPDMSLAGPDFFGSVLIPTTSVEQYGATLAKWLGLSDSQINDVFPNLARFAVRDLGFM